MNTEHHSPTPAPPDGHGAAEVHGNGHGHSHDDHDHGHDHIHELPKNPLLRYVFSTDHKIIGIQFLFSGLIFFVLGGLLAMAIRWQMAWPWAPIPVFSQAMEGTW